LPDTGPAGDITRFSLEAPVFSPAGGVYDGPVTLTLSAEPGTTIHYTLDGSLPTPDSPVYREPLVLEASDDPELMFVPTTSDELFPDWGYDKYQWLPPESGFRRHPVVRAVAVNELGESSRAAGHTYLIGKDAVPEASGTADDPSPVPVVMLITDPAGFFSDETGIYVPGNLYSEWRRENPAERVLGNSPANYLQRGMDWEREGHITLLEPDMENGFTQNIGLRIHGGFTRAWAQKTLRLYARAEYDEQNWFEYPSSPVIPKAATPPP
jgi:hypothetical protein